MDWAGLQDRVDERVEERDGGVMRDAVIRMEGSILGIRKIDRRRTELQSRTGGPPDAGQVIRLAADLQSDRRAMRERMIEGMKLVLDERQQETLDMVFGKFTLDQGRIDSTLGGSRIDLELALREAHGEKMTSEEARQAVTEANEELLRLLAKWTDARMERERAGLELFVAFQRDDETAIDRLTTTIGQRARTELAAAIAIRDRLMAGRSEVATIIATADPEIAERFTVITRAQASLAAADPLVRAGRRGGIGLHRPGEGATGRDRDAGVDPAGTPGTDQDAGHRGAPAANRGREVGIDRCSAGPPRPEWTSKTGVNPRPSVSAISTNRSRSSWRRCSSTWTASRPCPAGAAGSPSKPGPEAMMMQQLPPRIGTFLPALAGVTAAILLLANVIQAQDADADVEVKAEVKAELEQLRASVTGSGPHDTARLTERSGIRNG